VIREKTNFPYTAWTLRPRPFLQRRRWPVKTGTAYQGKVLRMNPDGSIPEDNPTIEGVQGHIFTYGDRNHQGLTVGPDGDLYVSEHGPNSDDEINHLKAGGNFGWPHVAGYKDDKAYRYINWSSTAEQCPNRNPFNVTSAISA